MLVTRRSDRRRCGARLRFRPGPPRAVRAGALALIGRDPGATFLGVLHRLSMLVFVRLTGVDPAHHALALPVDQGRAQLAAATFAADLRPLDVAGLVGSFVFVERVPDVLLGVAIRFV